MKIAKFLFEIQLLRGNQFNFYEKSVCRYSESKSCSKCLRDSNTIYTGSLYKLSRKTLTLVRKYISLKNDSYPSDLPDLYLSYTPCIDFGLFTILQPCFLILFAKFPLEVAHERVLILTNLGA